MFGHAPSDAVMLAFTHSSEVTEAFDGGAVEYLQLAQRLLALASEFAFLAGAAQGFDDTFIVIVADEPARTVTSVVAEVEGNVALRRFGVVEIGQLTVIV